MMLQPFFYQSDCELLHFMERQESFCYWPLSICQDVGDRRQLYKNCIVQTLLYSWVNSRVKIYKTFWERVTNLLVVTFAVFRDSATTQY